MTEWNEHTKGGPHRITDVVNDPHISNGVEIHEFKISIAYTHNVLINRKDQYDSEVPKPDGVSILSTLNFLLKRQMDYRDTIGLELSAIMVRTRLIIPGYRLPKFISKNIQVSTVICLPQYCPTTGPYYLAFAITNIM